MGTKERNEEDILYWQKLVTITSAQRICLDLSILIVSFLMLAPQFMYLSEVSRGNCAIFSFIFFLASFCGVITSWLLSIQACEAALQEVSDSAGDSEGEETKSRLIDIANMLTLALFSQGLLLRSVDVYLA